MKTILSILVATFFAASAFASKPEVRCKSEIYGEALKVLAHASLEKDGLIIHLESIEGVERTQRTYSTHLDSTDSSSKPRYDTYRVVLKNMNSCEVKSVTLITD